MFTNQFFLGPEPLIFSEAEAYCVSQSSHLASIHSNSSFYAARSLCQNVTNPEACWIGLQRNSIDSNTWNNIDGTTVDFGFDVNATAIIGQHPPWIVSQPGSTEPCVEYLGFASAVFWDFYWNDRRCDHINYPICNAVYGNNTSINTTVSTAATQIPNTSYLYQQTQTTQTSNMDTTTTHTTGSVPNILSFLPAVVRNDVTLMYILAIGAAVLLVLIVAICICMCCCNKRNKKIVNESDDHHAKEYNAVKKECEDARVNSDDDEHIVRIHMVYMKNKMNDDQGEDSTSSHESMYTDRYNTKKDANSEQYGTNVVDTDT